MKKFKILYSAVLATTALFFSSCEQENAGHNQENNTSQFSAEVLGKLKQLNFNSNGLELKTITHIDGAQEQMYQIEGDILMSEDELMDTNVTDKQFSSSYKVDIKKYPVIQVVGYNGKDFNGLSKFAQFALRNAVQYYNSLNTGIEMKLSFSVRRKRNGILVYKNPSIRTGPFLANAAFPKINGRPGKDLIINETINDNLSIRVIEGFLMHKLGHNIGLRHTDWNGRQSCVKLGGKPIIESYKKEATNHIKGTPKDTLDPTSIFNSCQRYFVTNAEFSKHDEKALRLLYPVATAK